MQGELDGLLVLDKPSGITSREVVDRAQRWFPRRTRIGHTGTLDPLATGVLVLCVGQATRLVEYVQQMRKTYRSVFRLGATSDSDDAEGQLQIHAEARAPGLEEIAQILPRWVGSIEQVPPAYSAMRVAGRRAHELARQGAEVQLAPRLVQVYGIAILRYAYPELEVEVECGKGTYIRSLARDVGQALGCGAYVQSLRRLRVGPFRADEAVPLESTREQARQRLLSMSLALADLPRIVLPEEELQRLQQGQKVAGPMSLALSSSDVAVFSDRDEMVAVATWDARSGRLCPVKVLRGQERSRSQSKNL